MICFCDTLLQAVKLTAQISVSSLCILFLLFNGLQFRRVGLRSLLFGLAHGMDTRVFRFQRLPLIFGGGFAVALVVPPLQGAVLGECNSNGSECVE
ncbi:hypothetical protein [Kingella sp. (in: b-proteobacteria)]|uniref:hypothetical protein n=1 Tax=Kingella sp. (in: b-proteobacteria) TaxID=2020713 RepID=UPI0026DBDCAC|nr:hypothetical protein [Kingella sp. (in: b-proteobacteria)]MDO4658486.1 hypothetical protein [Kingella sp. (in: b-proteobacteria)]